jgi:hypothetical protein
VSESGLAGFEDSQDGRDGHPGNPKIPRILILTLEKEAHACWQDYLAPKETEE